MDRTTPSDATLVGAVRRRTDEVVATLGDLDEDELLAPSLLPGWQRLTIVCHLRFGAATLVRLTDAALLGEPAAFYPLGREVQRPRTLEPDDGEAPAEVVASLAAHGRRLDASWSAMTEGQWATVVHEPAGQGDLGALPLAALLLLRLTEVEVHGTDLDLGLDDWSEPFVRRALPFRITRLARRRPSPPPAAVGDGGSWLLVATDGPTHLVTLAGDEVATRPAEPGEPATATIEGTSRDLLALLLGRALRAPLERRGDVAFADAFTAAFPGP